MIYVKSERAGERVMQSTKTFVEKRLKLKVNDEKSAVAPATWRPFLDFGFSVRDGEVKVRLDPKALAAAKARIRRLTARNWRVRMEVRIAALNRFTRGWTACFALADTFSASPTGRPAKGRPPAAAVGGSPVRPFLVALCLADTGRNSVLLDSSVRTSSSGMLGEPPDADPHVRWCGRGRSEPGPYPIPVKAPRASSSTQGATPSGYTRAFARPWSTTAAAKPSEPA
jgi:hypothetical protein